MNINKNNYQAFILDYYEGSLSEEQAASLMSFLEKYPELKEEFHEFEIIKLQDDIDNTTFSEKGLLKKPEPEISLPVTPENFELFCIAETEGLLSEKETQYLNSFVTQDPSYERTRKAYSLTVAKPDNKVVFKGKTNLKKQPAMKVLYKQITDENYAEFFSAYIDEELPSIQAEQLETYLRENPGRAKEFSQWRQVRLKPDFSIVFPNKSLLKRRQISAFRKVWYSVSAAAVVLIMASVFFMSDLIIDSDVRYSDITIKHLEPVLDSLEDIVGPAKAKPVEAEHQPGETLRQKQKAEATLADQQKDTWARDETKLLNASILAALPPRQLEHNTETAGLFTPKQKPLYAAASKQVVDGHHTDNDYVALPQLALAEFQKRSGIDFAPERVSVWDIAGAGLATISQLTGRSLTVQKKRNDSGRITYLAIGDNFEISRNKE